MQNRQFAFGPVALTTTMTTNLVNCAITSLAGPVGFTATQPYILLRYIHVVNKTAAAHTFSLWKGATGANGAGTELFSAESVPANSVRDFLIPPSRFDSTQFLVGGADANTALTLSGGGEIGFS